MENQKKTQLVNDMDTVMLLIKAPRYDPTVLNSVFTEPPSRSNESCGRAFCDLGDKQTCDLCRTACLKGCLRQGNRASLKLSDHESTFGSAAYSGHKTWTFCEAPFLLVSSTAIRSGGNHDAGSSRSPPKHIRPKRPSALLPRT